MSYPDSPGFKSRGTSSLAAHRIAPHAEALRDRGLRLSEGELSGAVHS